jgi:hypothetical protein
MQVYVGWAAVIRSVYAVHPALPRSIIHVALVNLKESSIFFNQFSYAFVPTTFSNPRS